MGSAQATVVSGKGGPSILARIVASIIFSCLVAAEILLQLNRASEATSIYEELVERNPESWSNYEGLEKCKNPRSEEERLEIYTRIAEKFPRAAVPRRMPLKFTTGKSVLACTSDITLWDTSLTGCLDPYKCTFDLAFVSQGPVRLHVHVHLHVLHSE